MEITPKTRLHIRIQNIIFLVLFLTLIALLAWISQRYSFEADWTATSRNTLSQASITLLQRMPDPINITAFARENNLLATRKNIKELISRYQKHKQDIVLTFINPDIEPDTTRAMGITLDGELIIDYNGRKEHVQTLEEEALTNTLQRLLRGEEQKILFLSGHGERNPHGRANHDYGLFIKHLETKGIKVESLNLSENPRIDDDTAIVVIAGPRVDYLPGEIKLIRQYLKTGGNLLWLHDPGRLYGLDSIADDLGISFHPGVIVDPTTQLLGISDPSFALITSYSTHPITKDFSLMTLFPRASGVAHKQNNESGTVEFLTTVDRSWSESDEIKGAIEFTQGQDIAGPLAIGLAISRSVPAGNPDNNNDKTSKQRIVVMGDGDFMSNTYLGNQGNQDLGYNIINWLSHDDNFIAIPVKTAPDTELVINNLTWSILGLFFLIIWPVMLLGGGVYIWLKRRKQ